MIYVLCVLVSGLAALSAAPRFTTELERRTSLSPATLQRLVTSVFLVAVALLTAVSALRYGIGTDYSMYERFFEVHIQEWDFAGNISEIPQEYLYVAVSTLFKGLGFSSEMFLGLVAIVTVSLFAYTIWKKSPYIGLSLLLYVLFCFYTGSFNYIRQGIALAIVFFAFSLRARFSWEKVALLLVASGFHTTALIAGIILLGLEYLPRSDRKALIWASVVAVSAAVLLKIPVVVDLLSAINPRYEAYIAGGDGGFGAFFIAGSRILVLIVIFYLVPLEKMSSELQRYTLFAFVGALLLLVVNGMPVLVRFEYYFGISLILAFPMAIKETTRKKVWPVWAALVALCAYFLVHTLRFDEVYPYSSIFSTPSV